MSESLWLTHWTALGSAPHMRRMNRLSHDLQWQAAIKLAIMINDGVASYRVVSRVLTFPSGSLTEEFWYLPEYQPSPARSPKHDMGWWLVPKRISRRANALVRAATQVELCRRSGICRSDDVTRRLRRWEKKKHWQKYLTFNARVVNPKKNKDFRGWSRRQSKRSLQAAGSVEQ